MTSDNYHHVNLTIEQGELHRSFTCTAPEDAPCRRRPPEPEERESWTAEEATVPGADCWAVEWVEAVGIRDAIVSTVDDQVLASVPVKLSFEEGVGIEPIVAEGLPDLDALESLAKAATPGPWTDVDDQGDAYSKPPATGAFLVEYGADEAQKMRDIRFIATADPQAVLALIAALRAAKGVR